MEKVDIGTRLVDQAGATMPEIVDSIEHVTAIMQMDDVTQHNAALVGQAAAAAESLQDQAGSLLQVVSVFKLDGMLRPATRVCSAPKEMVEAEYDGDACL